MARVKICGKLVMSNVVSFNNVFKSYKEINALIDVTIELQPGIYGLIGPNGAGKSTLIRLMATLDTPSLGSIKYNDTPVSEIKGHYRSMIGLMPQEQKGYEYFTGLSFLYYMAVLKGIDRADAKIQIQQLIKQVSLEDSIHRKLKTFSGGMRQRLMFAQALLGNPKILILDEPTAGLDPFERIKLRNYISQIAKDKIVLIATHVMQDIESIADKVFLLKEGKVVFSGSGEELLKSISGKVFEEQISVDQISKYQGMYKLSKVFKFDNSYLVRYLDDIRNDGNQTPNFEDAYLYYMVDHEDISE